MESAPINATILGHNLKYIAVRGGLTLQIIYIIAMGYCISIAFCKHFTHSLSSSTRFNRRYAFSNVSYTRISWFMVPRSFRAIELHYCGADMVKKMLHFRVFKPIWRNLRCHCSSTCCQLKYSKNHIENIWLICILFDL